MSFRDVRTLVQKVKSIPDLVKMLQERGTKVSIATVKQVLYLHNLKERSARKKLMLQNYRKKIQTTFAKLHMGTKIVLFGEMTSGLMKQK